MNDYRKKQAPKPPKMSAVEAVTKYGDDWNLIGNVPYDRAHTPDAMDAAWMRMMERGEVGRIRPGDLDE